MKKIKKMFQSGSTTSRLRAAWAFSLLVRLMTVSFLRQAARCVNQVPARESDEPAARPALTPKQTCRLLRAAVR
jgi:hypothetical protein